MLYITRKIFMSTENLQLGDQIDIDLNGFGTFTATIHNITDKGFLLMFDDYIALKQMNKQDTNSGGFEKSDLKKWMDTELLDAFPDWLKGRVGGLSIPTVGEIAGHDINAWYTVDFEPNDDTQLPLMKEFRNRVAFLNNKPESGWLLNHAIKECSSSTFAVVYIDGTLTFASASHSLGVRPKFWLTR